MSDGAAERRMWARFHLSTSFSMWQFKLFVGTVAPQDSAGLRFLGLPVTAHTVITDGNLPTGARRCSDGISALQTPPQGRQFFL